MGVKCGIYCIENRLNHKKYIEMLDLYNKYINIDYIFSLGLDLSKHQKEVELNDEIIQLDQTHSIKDNINNIYKRIKKAKETIRLANDNIAKANNEKEYYLSFQKEFDAKSEKEKDEF